MIFGLRFKTLLTIECRLSIDNIRQSS